MLNHLLPKHDKNLESVITARSLVLTGKVQGVGFRPFIYRIALANNLVGWVRNCVGIVEVFIQGKSHDIENFYNDLFEKKPVLAEVTIQSDKQAAINHDDSFNILQSQIKGDVDINVPTDLFLCDDCLAELNDPADRRYQYPFINCTQCGPRYTLITTLPYDRSNTSMAEFDLCPACLTEYENPEDRRFHAEPIGCPSCGPSLSFHVNRRRGDSLSSHSEVEDDFRDEVIVNDNATSLKLAVAALRDGKVIAVKGIGGYHLMCDASDTQAVLRLRKNKPRIHKPLAVMFPAPLSNPFGQAGQSVTLSDADKRFLLNPERPILLVEKRFLSKEKHSNLSEQIAPGLNEVGVMLPYSPLHHLLLNEFSGALVATSANISGEPVLIDNEQVEARLSHIADAFLHHNRPIIRPADDPVYRRIAGKPRPLRLGRGIAPLEMALPFKLAAPVLAVGAHMKNTVTLAWNNRAVISPHIGEMDSVYSHEVFENTVNDLQALYQIKATAIICDAHPGYTTTRWANKQGLAIHSVFHHHAHASAAYYECQNSLLEDNNIEEKNIEKENIMVFTWDGVGYGEDGTLWGGETFVGKPAEWQRVASMRPFNLPGGDKAGRQPWRSAAALCWEIGHPYREGELNEDKFMYPDANNQTQRDSLLYQAWEKKINAPQSSSVGRLFDAASALTGVRNVASFEGQGPMELEALCGRSINYIELDLSNNNNLLINNWEPLVPVMLDSALSIAERATIFHASLAHAILQQAIQIREKYSVNTVSFAGGVFQNRVLTETAIALLTENDFQVFLPELIPVNDAGISFGQVIEYGFKQTNHLNT